MKKITYFMRNRVGFIQRITSSSPEAEYMNQCHLTRTPQIHYFGWGDPTRPEQKEPDDECVCFCGATTYGAEKAKVLRESPATG
jgi:hypothetical protein